MVRTYAGNGERAVRVRADALKITMSNGLGIGEHALPDTFQLSTVAVERGQKRLELGLHLGLPEDWRPKPADDLHQTPVGFTLCDERRPDRRVGLADKRHLPQARPPDGHARR